MSQDKLVYLDYAATTPVDPEVLSAMQPYWQDKFGNAESVHKRGQEAMKAIDDARETVKDFLCAGALREIIFTSSATEANNLAIQGILSRLAFKNGKKVHVVTSSIEHASVLEPCKYMEARGIADVTYIKPNSEGILAPEKIREALRPDTVLVSIGYANNEIGVVQDIPEIARMIKEFREQKRIPYFHSDAVQAVQFLNMNVNILGVDLLTLSAHKIYGPKGVGALYVRDGVSLEPLMYGGNQEYGIRPSTHNTPLVVGFAEAITLLQENKKGDIAQKIQMLRDYALFSIQEKIHTAQINGSLEHRLPNNLNVCFSGEDGQSLLIGLSEGGICVSSGSACTARAQTPSYVIQALGKSEKDARSSVRITLGKYTTKNDIDYFIDSLIPLLHNRK